LGLAAFSTVQVSDNLVAFLVNESAQGNQNLNGDTDTNDSVVFV
jgi:hypothetical protein